MIQWQLKALVAAVSLGVSAMASAQAASSSTIVDVKPSDVGAAGSVVIPSGPASSTSDCSALNSDATIRCVQRQSRSVVAPTNVVVRSPRSGMMRRGGTMPGGRSGTAGLGAGAGSGGANGRMGPAGADGGAKGGGGSG